LPPAIIALGATCGLALWLGLGMRVQRRGGSSRDVWRAVWRVLVLTLLVGTVSQSAAVAGGHGGPLGALSILAYLLVLPLAFVISGIVAELVALAGYGLAERVWGYAVMNRQDEAVQDEAVRRRPGCLATALGACLLVVGMTWWAIDWLVVGLTHLVSWQVPPGGARADQGSQVDDRRQVGGPGHSIGVSVVSPARLLHTARASAFHSTKPCTMYLVPSWAW
jgi:hypothetical protein